MKKNRKRLLLILDLLLVLLIVGGVFLFQKRSEARERAAVGEEALNRRYVQTVTLDGEEVALKRGLTSVLLIGTDNFVDDAKQLEIEAFYNNNLADFLVVLVFDHSAHTVTPFQICRDTMCDVPWLSVNGLVGGTQWEQITYAHTYGSGKEDSCVNTRNAVEGLLHGVPIDHYFAFTMDAVPVANDLVGGVTVTLEDDIPALGNEYVKGAHITLKGQAALRFVRYRNIELIDDNLTRMAHQRLYINAFTDAARAAAAANPDLVTDAWRAVEKFLCTDLSVENFTDMVNHLTDYELLPTVTPTGEYRLGEYAEYYMDPASLTAGIRSTFCKEQ